MDFNKVQIAGHLGRDVELKYTPKGTAVAELSVAVNRKWSDESGEKKEETTWVNVTAWGRTAETCGQYLAKGSNVFIEGRLSVQSWDDKETGKKRSKMLVTAERVHFLTSADRGDRDERQSSPPTEKEAAQVGAGASAEDDNIPF